MTAVGTIVIVINSSVAARGMAYSVVMFMLLGLVYGSLLNCPKKQVGVMAFLCAQRITDRNTSTYLPMVASRSM